MGARLCYAKVVDRETFYVRHGGKMHPGLENEIVANSETGLAGAFLVLRGWGEDHGTFTERWRIEGSGGVVFYESSPREIHLASKDHIERLEDEVADLKIEYAADNYSVVFILDENEVARTRFRVNVPAL